MFLDSKITKTDDSKKTPITKPAFSGPSPAAQRKDSAGQKVESHIISKTDDSSKLATASSQVSQSHRTEKTPPYATEKSQHSSAGQSTIGSKTDKTSVPKKDDTSYSHSSRGSAAPINRGKPQVNAQSTSSKPSSQTIPAKPMTSNTKPPPTNINQSQAPVNVSSAIGSANAANRQQPPNKMAPRFVKQQRDRTGSNSSNTWEKGGDMAHISDANESDFTQRSNASIQAIDKTGQDAGNKTDSTAKMSTIIFENTNFKSMPPGPIKRQTTPSNQQPMPNAPQQPPRVSQYDQVQSNNLGGHHSHHSQNQHHLDKKADDVFKNASSGNFQDMLDSQQQVRST